MKKQIDLLNILNQKLRSTTNYTDLLKDKLPVLLMDILKSVCSPIKDHM